MSARALVSLRARAIGAGNRCGRTPSAWSFRDACPITNSAYACSASMSASGWAGSHRVFVSPSPFAPLTPLCQFDRPAADFASAESLIVLPARRSLLSSSKSIAPEPSSSKVRKSSDTSCWSTCGRCGACDGRRRRGRGGGAAGTGDTAVAATQVSACSPSMCMPSRNSFCEMNPSPFVSNCWKRSITRVLTARGIRLRDGHAAAGWRRGSARPRGSVDFSRRHRHMWTSGADTGTCAGKSAGADGGRYAGRGDAHQFWASICCSCAGISFTRAAVRSRRASAASRAVRGFSLSFSL